MKNSLFLAALFALTLIACSNKEEVVAVPAAPVAVQPAPEAPVPVPAPPVGDAEQKK